MYIEDTRRTYCDDCDIWTSSCISEIILDSEWIINGLVFNVIWWWFCRCKCHINEQVWWWWIKSVGSFRCRSQLENWEFMLEFQVGIAGHDHSCGCVWGWGKGEWVEWSRSTMVIYGHNHPSNPQSRPYRNWSITDFKPDRFQPLASLSWYKELSGLEWMVVILTKLVGLPTSNRGKKKLVGFGLDDFWREFGIYWSTR